MNSIGAVAILGFSFLSSLAMIAACLIPIEDSGDPLRRMQLESMRAGLVGWTIGVVGLSIFMAYAYFGGQWPPGN